MSTESETNELMYLNEPIYLKGWLPKLTKTFWKEKAVSFLVSKYTALFPGP